MSDSENIVFKFNVFKIYNDYLCYFGVFNVCEQFQQTPVQTLVSFSKSSL